MFKKPKEIFDALMDDGIEIIENKVQMAKVRNSRVCPKNGVTNPKRDTNLPLTYIGGEGVLMFSVDKEDNDKFRDFFEEKHIHLIVGGAISGSLVDKRYIYQYIINFFIDDFPEMKELHEEMVLLSCLKKDSFLRVISISDLNNG